MPNPNLNPIPPGRAHSARCLTGDRISACLLPASHVSYALVGPQRKSDGVDERTQVSIMYIDIYRYISIYLSIYLSIHPSSIYLSDIHLSIYLSIDI